MDEKEVFHRHLKSTGNNITSQREVILKVFLEASGHMTAGEICQRAARRTRRSDSRLSTVR